MFVLFLFCLMCVLLCCLSFVLFSVFLFVGSDLWFVLCVVLFCFVWHIEVCVIVHGVCCIVWFV